MIVEQEQWKQDDKRQEIKPGDVADFTVQEEKPETSARGIWYKTQGSRADSKKSKDNRSKKQEGVEQESTGGVYESILTRMNSTL